MSKLGLSCNSQNMLILKLLMVLGSGDLETTVCVGMDAGASFHGHG